MLAEQNVANCPFAAVRRTRKPLKWTAKIVDYVEWVYALQGVLNTGDEKVTLKALFDVFNNIFGLDVKDFSLYFTSIKNRKKGDRTSFLDEAKKQLIQRMADADSKPAKK
ncbi:hypothetical protein AGMMS49574_28710 [Bacteroidia bacterium]|nr:hypothetical protein AGMMS49574_28710 [Bacteroidia bacterium]